MNDMAVSRKPLMSFAYFNWTFIKRHLRLVSSDPFAPESGSTRRRYSYEHMPGDSDIYSVARVQAPSDLHYSLPGVDVRFRPRLDAGPCTHARRNYPLCYHETNYRRLPIEST